MVSLAATTDTTTPTAGGHVSRRKKRSRWATDDDDKTFIPGMPTVIPQNLDKKQEEQYLRKHNSNCRSNNNIGEQPDTKKCNFDNSKSKSLVSEKA